MKKLAIAFVAALSIATTCLAQPQNDSTRRQRRFDPQEMIQRRTNDAVKKYGLDEAQAKKLLALNQKYDTLLMRPMGGPRRGGRPEGGPGPQMGDRQRPDSVGKHPELTEEQKANFEKGRQKMDEQRQKMAEARKAYDTELQTILTSDQYKQYKEDTQRRGPRPERRQ